MDRLKPLGLALAAAFAFSGIAAATAPAVEGPFFKVNGKTLKAGETRLQLATAKERILFLSPGSGTEIECAGFSLPEATAMQINGVAAGNAGSDVEVIHFTGCTLIVGPHGCSVENESILTPRILGLLGYASSTKGGPVLVLYQPEAGKVFSTIKFTGAECAVPSVPLTGTLIGQAQVGGVPDPVGGGTESLHTEVAFTAPAKTIWVEHGGLLTEVKGKIEFAGIAAKVTEIALLLVDDGGKAAKWGIFS